MMKKPTSAISEHAPPTWLPEKTVAQRLDVSKYTIQRMRKAGKLKAKKIGNRWKYREDWLREYEDQEDTQCPKSSGSVDGSLTGRCQSKILNTWSGHRTA
jgi:excisionase family DNA binding protein